MSRDAYRVLRDRAPSGCCSACGQTVPDAGLRVDLQTNTISAGGLMMIVQPRTAEFVECLLRSFPNYVAREIIISRVWGNNALDRIVDAQATRARVSLQKLGWTILSIREKGYRIAPNHQPGIEISVVPQIASFARLTYSRPR